MSVVSQQGSIRFRCDQRSRVSGLYRHSRRRPLTRLNIVTGNKRYAHFRVTEFQVPLSPIVEPGWFIPFTKSGRNRFYFSPSCEQNCMILTCATCHDVNVLQFTAFVNCWTDDYNLFVLLHEYQNTSN